MYIAAYLENIQMILSRNHYNRGKEKKQRHTQNFALSMTHVYKTTFLSKMRRNMAKYTKIVSGNCHIAQTQKIKARYIKLYARCDLMLHDVSVYL
jgi:hypothetical protein